MLNIVHNVYYTRGLKWQGLELDSSLVQTKSEMHYPVYNDEITRTFYKVMLIVLLVLQGLEHLIQDA